MPFQSEKQRKYLWANEPAIAREWTDKYGSRVKKDTGGITRFPFFQGGYPNFFQMTPEKIAEAKNLSWKDAWNLEKKYKYNPKYPGGVGKGKYTLEGLKSLMGMGDPKIGGASPLTRKLALMGSSPGMFNAFTSLGTTGLPLAYTYGASKLQESLPMSLIGQGGLSDQNPYFGAMGVSVDPKVEETLRYGDDGKPSPDTGEGSTLAKVWDAIKNEFGGSAEAAGVPINKITQDEEEPYDFTDRLRRRGDFTTKYPSYNPWQMRAAQAPGLRRNAGRVMDFLRGPGTRLTPAQQRANQNYMTQQRITRNPQTGRMQGGLFAGQNAPGTSYFGSKTFQEMANKNLQKWGKTAPQAKVDAWKAVVTSGRDPGTGTSYTGHGKSGMGRDPRDRMARGGLASLWQR